MLNKKCALFVKTMFKQEIFELLKTDFTKGGK